MPGTDLRKAVTVLATTLAATEQRLTEAIAEARLERRELRREIDAYRVLSKYNRRTHFWTMGAMVFGALLLADVSRAYAHDSQWWGLLFWSSQHGSGGVEEWTIRAVGLIWQAALVAYMVLLAQVPPWLADKTVTEALTEDEFLALYPNDPPSGG